MSYPKRYKKIFLLFYVKYSNNNAESNLVKIEVSKLLHCTVKNSIHGKESGI